MTDIIRSIGDIQRLVREGFRDWSRYGDVAATYHEGLVLFNYTNAAQFANRWNFFEQVSRGLILHATTGTVVARGFDKFFNWGSGEGWQTFDQKQGRIERITEKADGSLGIAYFDAMDGLWHVATRGSFVSEQARWATEFLRNHLDPTALKYLTSFYRVGTPITLLFEIIYPENRIIVDYGDLRTLTLLAVRYNSGGFMTYDAAGFIAEKISLPLIPSHTGTIDSLIEWCQTAGIEQEGFVVEFVDGSRAKFKSVRYLQVARLLSGISKSRVVQSLRDNGYHDLIELVPDEFMAQIQEWHREATEAFDTIRVEVERAYLQRPTDCARGTFARWAVGLYPDIKHYLFALLDGKPIDDMIWKQVLEQLKEGVQA